MTKIFIAGSRKFYSQIQYLTHQLQEKKVIALTPMKGIDDTDFEHEKKALLTAFSMIEDSDLIYVVADGGYIGKTVAMEIAYAYSKGKKIVSSAEISELSARALISSVNSYTELLDSL